MTRSWTRLDRMEIHRFMLSYQAEHRRPPTTQEIIQDVRSSPAPSKSTVRYALRNLIDVGLARRFVRLNTGSGARNIEAVPDPARWPLREWVTAVHHLGGGRWAFDFG